MEGPRMMCFFVCGPTATRLSNQRDEKDTVCDINRYSGSRLATASFFIFFDIDNNLSPRCRCILIRSVWTYRYCYLSHALERSASCSNMRAYGCLAGLFWSLSTARTLALEVADPSRRLSFGQLLASSLALHQGRKDPVPLTAEGTYSIQQALADGFPQALTYSNLVRRVSRILRQTNEPSMSPVLLASSLCCDELNRGLEREFELYCKCHCSRCHRRKLPLCIPRRIECTFVGTSNVFCVASLQTEVPLFSAGLEGFHFQVSLDSKVRDIIVKGPHK